MTMKAWPTNAYHLTAIPSTMFGLGREVYDRVLRTDFTQPGFCLVDLGTNFTSPSFRRYMVQLKEVLTVLHELQTWQTLVWLSAARFDQQTTTKAHLDGGPEESFLMLGYEPTLIHAELTITDYTRAAHDHNRTPTEFLAQHNPMFRNGQEVLRPYETALSLFNPSHYQLLFINNSSAPFTPEHRRWQGTLHAASIPNPDERQRRIINSTMIAPASKETAESLSRDELTEFMTTQRVRRQGYDKSHLQDD